MSSSEIGRREFHQLTLAAFGGVIAGVTVGCNQDAPTPTKNVAIPGKQPSLEVTLTAEAAALITDDVNTCRGLNSCKGKGRDKENECAGRGTCASIADASCGGHNDCRGQGGCGTNPGMNSCNGQGGCHIPLMDSAWQTARTAFETAMKQAGKEFGTAPAKKL